MTDTRIGFCCKMLPDPTQKFVGKKDLQEWLDRHNCKSTTVAYLDRQTPAARIEKICSIITHNQQALATQIKMLSTWPQALRMMRIGSEILPVRTFERYKHLYQEPSVVRVLEGFESVGNLARKHDVRLSTHPGQYTILTSDNADVVNRAIEDLEYHAEIFRLMGFDASDQRQEINIHGGPNRPDMVDRFRAAVPRLSKDTQQWLSVENDEFSHGLDNLLPLADQVKICVDINHYWIKEGDYLQPDDPRIARVVESWRGARPEIHVAWPHEQVLTDHEDLHQLPNMQVLESKGYRRAKLRAHSDDAWLPAISKYALEFWDIADLCVEAKYKNLASTKLYNMAIST